MSKRQVIILIVVGLVIFLATFAGVYLMQTNDDNKPKEKEKSVLKVKNFTLEYGTYIGEEKDYDPDQDKIVTKPIKVVLTRDTIDGVSYYVKDNSLYVGSGDSQVEMYEVTKDNEFTLLAGSGILFKLMQDDITK